MSTQYPSFSLTNFPDSFDNYLVFTDVSASNYTYVQQYYSYINAGDFTSAAQLLADHSELSTVIINAKTMQRIYDMILAMQHTYKDDVVTTFANIFNLRGTYSATTEYTTFDVVYYNNIPYMCAVQSAIGITPSTNPSSWEMLAIVGASGTGLSFYSTWSSSQSYSVEDSVPYGSKLYVCIQANTNQNPSTSPDYWQSIITVPQQIVFSQNQSENQNTGDIWMQTNSTDNSVKMFVKQSDGTYLQRYVENKADYVKCNDGQSVEEKVGNITADISSAVAAHNSAGDAHADIRAEITAIVNAMHQITFTNAYTIPPSFRKPTQLPTPLSVARYNLAATTVGNYALFGGGYGSSAVVDAYDTVLTRTTPTPLSQARQYLAATTVGIYALFGGGYDGDNWLDIVDAYDTVLTRTTPTPLSARRNDLAATTVGNYALFGGGDGARALSAIVDAYDTALTRTTPTPLSVAREDLAATTVGIYALFGGGYRYSSSAVVDAYDTALTRTTPTPLSVARNNLAATTVGNYALFGGGSGGGSVVDAYNTVLTRTTPTPLSVARYSLAATTVGNYALFGGGSTGNSSAVVDAYDTALTRTTPTPLSQARQYLAATTVGIYALFGGGLRDDRKDSNAVDAYEDNPNYLLTLFVPAWYAYALNGAEETVVKADTTLSLSNPTPFNGYLKPATKTYTGQI